MAQINEYLLEAAGQGNKIVLIIDEAQAMPLKTLETLRLLTNLETEKQKLLQIVLFGQPELDEILQKKSIRQLRQRISFQLHLEPLNKKQVRRISTTSAAYCRQYPYRPVGALAISTLHFYSRGIPRLINILTHKALLAAYGKGLQHYRLAADTSGGNRYRRYPPTSDGGFML